MSIHIIFVFLSLLNLHAQADVDLKNGNFFYSWIDAELSSKNFFWQLQRSYNSRVNRVGYFGQGWCSPLETKLILSSTSNKTLEIQNCGSGEKVSYFEDNGEWKQGDQVITLIDEFYILKVKGTTQLQFNKNGDLDAFWLRDEKANLKYQDGRLNLLKTIAGSFTFVFDEDGKVLEINNGSTTVAKYTYHGADLISVTNSWGNHLSYQYDKLGNMTLAKWPDKTFLKLNYDTRRDWVTSVIDRDGCVENYSYESKELTNETKVTSTVLRNCKKKNFDKKVIEIVFDKKNKLKDIQQSVGNKWKKIEYNSFGKPKKISDSIGLVQLFDYDKYGNLTLKQNGSEKTMYYLNDKKQITEVTSDKVKMKLEYDERGRARRVIASYDSTTSDLAISYVDNTEKLKTLNIKGTGSITYSYDSEGSVIDTKIQSKNNNSFELNTNINRTYNIYTTLTDEASIFGGLD